MARTSPPGERVLVAALVCADAASLATGLALALLVRYRLPGWPGAEQPNAATLALTALLAPLCAGLLAVWGLYRTDELFRGHREYQRAAHACTYAAFTGLALSFLLGLDVSRGALLSSWLLACAAVCTQRFVFRRVVGRLRRQGRLVRRALIVGADEHAVTLARQLAQPASGWQVLGFLDDYAPSGAELTGGLRVLGDPASAVRVAAELGATDLIVVPHAVSWEAQRDLLERAATSDRPAVHLAPGFYHLLAAGARPVDGYATPLVTLERLRITGLDATLKRVLDYGLALALLPALLSVVGVLRVAANRSGSGRLFDRRTALGLRGRQFELLAIAPPAGENPGAALRLRAALARGRAAKLPNVLNVLAGRMSFVGPRVLPAGDGALERPWARTLLLVRPGLTGPSAHERDGASGEEQALRDVAYVREYSLWLDLRLLVQSLLRVVRREAAVPPAYVLPKHEQDAPAEAAGGR